MTDNPDLTPREVEILQISSNDNCAEDVGRILGISKRTVEIHKTSIYQKLGVHTIQGACCLAMRLGLLR